MKINVCINGTFRYPAYVRHFADAGMLGHFYFAHRRGTTAATVGLAEGAATNLWAKEYALHAAARALPSRGARRLETPICDIWQSGVIRRWRDCDAVEAVIGGVADRVLAFAKRRGCATLGHPVCAHPDTVSTLVGTAYAGLGLDPRWAVPPALERRYAEIAVCDQLLVDSRFVWRSYVAAGVAPERLKLVTPGVDLSRFRPLRPSRGRDGIFRVVCVGTISPRKAQHILLRAWALLKLPRAELVLVGPTGRDAHRVLRGFENSFTYLRRVPNAELPGLLARASAFVLPSVEDGCPQAPIEAMACGIPVIVTENVGTADILSDGVDGFVVPALDAEALAARLELLYRRRDLARTVGEAAAATATRHGSWSAYVAAVLDIHRALVGAPPRREAA